MFFLGLGNQKTVRIRDNFITKAISLGRKKQGNLLV
jgi:hypothetical protein